MKAPLLLAIAIAPVSCRSAEPEPKRGGRPLLVTVSPVGTECRFEVDGRSLD